MKKISTTKCVRFAAMVAAIFVAMSAAAPVTHAQTRHSNDTYMLVSRNDGGRVNMHVEGRGDHCWATTSDDRGVGVSMGDDLCTLWDEGADDAESLRAKIAPSKISFHLGGKSYAITDAATVKRARDLFDPLVKIGEQQGLLGKQQGVLGRQQGELGRQQRDVKVKVPDMSADILKIEAEVKRLSSSGGTQSELGDLQSEIGDLQGKIGDVQSQAGDVQSKIGDQQSELGDKQSGLGDQQSVLGDKAQSIATDLARNLRAMLAQTIESGAAKPE